MSSNENQIQVEVVQPEIDSQIRRTTLEDLREWIKDGKLQPNHQVRIKNLSWVEARNIPAFQALFEAKRKDQIEQLNHSHSQTLTVAHEPARPQTAEEKTFPKPKLFSLKKESDLTGKEISGEEISAENEIKTAAPSVVFQAFEKRLLAREKHAETKKEFSEKLSEPQKKSPFKKKTPPSPTNKKSFSHNNNLVLKRIFIFVAGCLLAAVLAYGGSYLWVYQLKTVAQIDEKSLPEIATLADKLTSDKLGLRLKEETRKRELKEAGSPEDPAQHQDIVQQIAQLEKQFETQRKTAVEKHKIRFQETDFNMTFSFSLVVLLVAFVVIRVFYDKSSQPVENTKPSKLPIESKTESDDFQSVSEPKSDDKASQNVAPEKEFTGESNRADRQEKPKDSASIVYISQGENNADDADVKLPSSVECVEHRDKPANFHCDFCENYFCADCAKSFSEAGDHCPFCRVTCKPIETGIGDGSPPRAASEQTKKPNLLELGKDSNFVVYDYPDERNYKLGIVPALLIALLFSASISIFWVYKISPYLESRNQEISQNVLPNAVKNSDAPKIETAETRGATAAENGEAANEACVNPTTKETFECDDETRKALYEQNRKMKAVEDAQKKISDKSSVIAPAESSSAQENAAQKAKQPSADESAKMESEKQQLIKTFGISFVIIFGLLLSTRLFHKEKNSQPD